MNTYSLVYYGNPILRKKAEAISDITPEIKDMVLQMEKIMHATDGCGIAAPQVGVSLRVFILSIPFKDEKNEWKKGPLEVYINPVITPIGNAKETLEEGCLSIPYLKGAVTRPLEVEVEALNLDGTPFKVTLKGWHARAIFHENDHLNGVLYIDRLSNRDKQKIEPLLKKLKKKYESTL